MAWGARSILDPMNDQRTNILKYDPSLLVQDKRIQQWHGIKRKQERREREKEGGRHIPLPGMCSSTLECVCASGPETSLDNKISFLH